MSEEQAQACRNQPGGFLSPVGEQLPDGLDNALAAQAMFPVTSGAGMAGQPGENPVADAAAANNLAGEGGVWDQIADRLRSNPEYVGRFKAAYADIDSAADITYVHAANAISAFEGSRLALQRLSLRPLVLQFDYRGETLTPPPRRTRWPEACSFTARPVVRPVTTARCGPTNSFMP